MWVVNASEESSGGSSEMEESEEESKEDSTEAFVVSAIEARSLASTLIGANWEEPQVLVFVAGGVAFESAVPALEVTVLSIDERSLDSTSTGANLEEPCMTAEVEGEQSWNQLW